MSILTINPSAEKQRVIRQLVEDLLDGVIPVAGGSVDIRLPDPMVLTKRIAPNGEFVELTWTGKVEADVPGWLDPDVVSVRMWPTESRAFLRLSDIRIVHDAQ